MLSSTWSIVYWYSPVHSATMRRTSLRTRAMKRAAFMLPRVLGAIGEQPAQIAIVEVRVLDAVVAALPLVVRAQRLAQLVERLDLRRVVTSIGLPASSRHQRVHVLELLERRPVGVARAPVGLRVQPDGERLGEVLVGMALRVPAVEVQDEALAVRLRRVVVRDTACRTARRAAAGAAAAAACRRCRWRGRPRGAGSSCTTRACRLRPRASARARAARAADARGRTGSRRPARRRARTTRPTARSAARTTSGRARRARLQLRDAVLERRCPRSSRRAGRSAGRAASRRASRPTRRAGGRRVRPAPARVITVHSLIGPAAGPARDRITADLWYIR